MLVKIFSSAVLIFSQASKLLDTNIFYKMRFSFFTQGSGEIYLRHPDEGQGEQEELYEVNAQDIVTVQAGVFHRVHNKGKTKLKYLRVMNRP